MARLAWHVLLGLMVSCYVVCVVARFFLRAPRAEGYPPPTLRQLWRLNGSRLLLHASFLVSGAIGGVTAGLISRVGLGDFLDIAIGFVVALFVWVLFAVIVTKLGM